MADTIYIPHQCIPRKDKDTLLEPAGPPVAVTNRREFWLEQGSEYTFPLNMRLYHHVEPVFSGHRMVITKVTGIPSVGNEKELPTVLVRKDCEPDNEFDRYGFDEIARMVYEDAVIYLEGKL
jgi:hypothetical protein